jgi:class 3 adenylate cyclase
MTFSADMREHLGAISCPTLVISRTEAFADLVEHGRYLAEAIPGDRFVTFPGPDMLPWAGDFEVIVDEIEEFLAGSRRGHAAERTLATALFVDIMDSTGRAAAAVARRWHGVLDELDVNVQRLLARYDRTFGEIELRGDDIGGPAVHIATRVSALAGADEVLATGTVRDLVVGSGIAFADRGRHDLKGVPGQWELLSVTSP